MRSGLSSGLIRELGPSIPGQTGGPVLSYEISGEITGQEGTLKVAVDGQEIEVDITTEGRPGVVPHLRR